MSHVQACLETSLEYQNQYLQGFKQRFWVDNQSPYTETISAESYDQNKCKIYFLNTNALNQNLKLETIG